MTRMFGWVGRAGSAAAAPVGRANRAAKVVRRRMAGPLVWVSRVVKEGDGRWAVGNRLIVRGRKRGCQPSVRFPEAHPGGFRHPDREVSGVAVLLRSPIER